MKINRLITIVLLFILALALPMSTGAKKKVVDIYDLTLDENLAYPEINNEKQATRVQDYQYDMAVALKKKNFDVELMRDGEVIVITLPAGQLFNQNDTTLTDLGKHSLKPLLPLLINPGFYKMLLVMHSDNTGSNRYTQSLTGARVNAVFDWIDDNASVDFVVPYALGATDPVVNNNSIDNRRRNRRLEIYLVPGEVMIQQAKKGRINIKTISK